ncbi:MAG: orotate phosphoribosyltransferase [Acidilobaceae archaeon]|nr:orotate phosphoribosyltransferase [Acidilobaceae archaeon]MCX8165252.1 orotate phosphoribosyltransferase [Acidilobaceae archaeon]MDW7973678.1 orotate phosphoribosyltransferase [Sulfolobales archaeon]
MELAELIEARGALLFGEFTLTSGAKSSYYLDLRKLLGDGRSFRRAAELLAGRARELEPFDVAVGVATAGIPWASAIALLMGKGVAYVRSEPKAHGTGSLVEGEPRGKCVVIDDVATTGGSLERAVLAVRSLCEVRGALVLVDRLQGARERLAALGVRLVSVATVEEIMANYKGQRR